MRPVRDPAVEEAEIVRVKIDLAARAVNRCSMYLGTPRTPVMHRTPLLAAVRTARLNLESAEHSLTEGAHPQGRGDAGR